MYKRQLLSILACSDFPENVTFHRNSRLRARDPLSTVSDAFWLHFRCFRTTLGSISGGFRWRPGAISSLDPLSRPFPCQRAPPRRAVFLLRPTNPPTAPGASGSPGTWPRTCPDTEPPQRNAQGPEGGRRCPPPRGNSIRSSAHHLDCLLYTSPSPRD